MLKSSNQDGVVVNILTVVVVAPFYYCCDNSVECLVVALARGIGVGVKLIFFVYGELSQQTFSRHGQRVISD
jgi:hypothetical protein